MSINCKTTKKGKPVAVINSYEEYRHSKKVAAYKKIMKSREAFLKAAHSL